MFDNSFSKTDVSQQFLEQGHCFRSHEQVKLVADAAPCQTIGRLKMAPLVHGHHKEVEEAWPASKVSIYYTCEQKDKPPCRPKNGKHCETAWERVLLSSQWRGSWGRARNRQKQ